MRPAPDSIVVELLQESLMQEAIKDLGEVDDHKVHLPSCINCLSKLMHKRQQLSLAATWDSKMC